MSPSRVKNSEPKRAACLLLAAVLLYTASAAGVCMVRGISASGEGCGEYIVVFDVCGSGPAFVVLQSLDTQASADASAVIYYPYISLIPPMPVKAVASAEPGDTEKPPEA